MSDPANMAAPAATTESSSSSVSSSLSSSFEVEPGSRAIRRRSELELRSLEEGAPTTAIMTTPAAAAAAAAGIESAAASEAAAETAVISGRRRGLRSDSSDGGSRGEAGEPSEVDDENDDDGNDEKTLGMEERKRGFDFERRSPSTQTNEEREKQRDVCPQSPSSIYTHKPPNHESRIEVTSNRKSSSAPVSKDDVPASYDHVASGGNCQRSPSHDDNDDDSSDEGPASPPTPRRSLRAASRTSNSSEHPRASKSAPLPPPRLTVTKEFTVMANIDDDFFSNDSATATPRNAVPPAALEPEFISIEDLPLPIKKPPDVSPPSSGSSMLDASAKVSGSKVGGPPPPSSSKGTATTTSLKSATEAASLTFASAFDRFCASGNPTQWTPPQKAPPSPTLSEPKTTATSLYENTETSSIIAPVTSKESSDALLSFKPSSAASRASASVKDLPSDKIGAVNRRSPASMPTSKIPSPPVLMTPSTSTGQSFRPPPPLEALSAFAKNNLGSWTKASPVGASSVAGTSSRVPAQAKPPFHATTKMVSILKPKPTPAVVPSATSNLLSTATMAPTPKPTTSSPGMKGFACHACADECRSIVALMQHHFNTHMTYRCTICGQTWGIKPKMSPDGSMRLNHAWTLGMTKLHLMQRHSSAYSAAKWKEKISTCINGVPLCSSAEFDGDFSRSTVEENVIVNLPANECEEPIAVHFKIKFIECSKASTPVGRAPGKVCYISYSLKPENADTGKDSSAKESRSKITRDSTTDPIQQQMEERQQQQLPISRTSLTMSSSSAPRVHHPLPMTLANSMNYSNSNPPVNPRSKSLTDLSSKPNAVESASLGLGKGKEPKPKKKSGGLLDRIAGNLAARAIQNASSPLSTSAPPRRASESDDDASSTRSSVDLTSGSRASVEREEDARSIEDATRPLPVRLPETAALGAISQERVEKLQAFLASKKTPTIVDSIASKSSESSTRRDFIGDTQRSLRDLALQRGFKPPVIKPSQIATAIPAPTAVPRSAALSQAQGKSVLSDARKASASTESNSAPAIHSGEISRAVAKKAGENPINNNNNDAGKAFADFPHERAGFSIAFAKAMNQDWRANCPRPNLELETRIMAERLGKAQRRLVQSSQAARSAPRLDVPAPVSVASQVHEPPPLTPLSQLHPDFTTNHAKADKLRDLHITKQIQSNLLANQQQQLQQSLKKLQMQHLQKMTEKNTEIIVSNRTEKPPSTVLQHFPKSTSSDIIDLTADEVGPSFPGVSQFNSSTKSGSSDSRGNLAAAAGLSESILQLHDMVSSMNSMKPQTKMQHSSPYFEETLKGNPHEVSAKRNQAEHLKVTHAAMRDQEHVKYLNAEMILDESAQNFVCKSCSMTYRDLLAYQRHVHTRHGQEALYVIGCKYCHALKTPCLYNSLYALRQHFEAVHKQKPKRSDLYIQLIGPVGTVENSSSNLTTNSQSETLQCQPPFLPPGPQFQTLHQSLATVPTEITIPNNTGTVPDLIPKRLPTQCRVCGKTFSSGMFFENHFRMAHEREPTEYDMVLLRSLPGAPGSYAPVINPEENIPVQKDDQETRDEIPAIDENVEVECKRCMGKFPSQLHLFNHFLIVHKLHPTVSDMVIRKINRTSNQESPNLNLPMGITIKKEIEDDCIILEKELEQKAKNVENELSKTVSAPMKSAIESKTEKLPAPNPKLNNTSVIEPNEERYSPIPPTSLAESNHAETGRIILRIEKGADGKRRASSEITTRIATDAKKDDLKNSSSKSSPAAQASKESWSLSEEDEIGISEGNSNSIILKKQQDYLNITCKFCKIPFTLQALNMYDRHLVMAHKGQLDSDTDCKAFECTLCPAAFTSSTLLLEHISETHSEINLVKFTCKHCQKTFKSANKLEFHISQKHSSPKCSFCGMIFQNHKQHKHHMKSVHESNFGKSVSPTKHTDSQVLEETSEESSSSSELVNSAVTDRDNTQENIVSSTSDVSKTGKKPDSIKIRIPKNSLGQENEKIPGEDSQDTKATKNKSEVPNVKPKSPQVLHSFYKKRVNDALKRQRQPPQAPSGVPLFGTRTIDTEGRQIKLHLSAEEKSRLICQQALERAMGGSGGIIPGATVSAEGKFKPLVPASKARRTTEVNVSKSKEKSEAPLLNRNEANHMEVKNVSNDTLVAKAEEPAVTKPKLADVGHKVDQEKVSLSPTKMDTDAITENQNEKLAVSHETGSEEYMFTSSEEHKQKFLKTLELGQKRKVETPEKIIECKKPKLDTKEIETDDKTPSGNASTIYEDKRTVKDRLMGRVTRRSGGLKEAIAFTTRELVKLASQGPVEIRNLVSDGAESETNLIHGILKEHGISSDLMTPKKTLSKEGQKIMKERVLAAEENACVDTNNENIATDETFDEEDIEEKEEEMPQVPNFNPEDTQCHLCNRKFSTAWHAKRHFLFTHKFKSEEDDQLEDDKNDKTDNEKSVSTVTVVHGEEQCRLCSRTFSSFWNAKRHYTLVHKVNLKVVRDEIKSEQNSSVMETDEPSCSEESVKTDYCETSFIEEKPRQQPVKTKKIELFNKLEKAQEKHLENVFKDSPEESEPQGSSEENCEIVETNPPTRGRSRFSQLKIDAKQTRSSSRDSSGSITSKIAKPLKGPATKQKSGKIGRPKMLSTSKCDTKNEITKAVRVAKIKKSLVTEKAVRAAKAVLQKNLKKPDKTIKGKKASAKKVIVKKKAIKAVLKSKHSQKTIAKKGKGKEVVIAKPRGRPPGKKNTPKSKTKVMRGRPKK